MTPFSALTAAMHEDGGTHLISVPQDWLQGRTAYGGLSAALTLEAIYRSEETLPPLRSAQFCFIGPATGELRVSNSVLRKGKSTVVVGASLDGESGIAVRSTLCFGTGRASAHNYNVFEMPVVPAPESCPSYYTFPNLPNFMSHFDGRLVHGERPGTGSDVPEMTVWVKHLDSGEGLDVVRLLALADALPPSSLIMSSVPTVISTMTWSIDMLSAEPRSPSGWWLVRCEADTSQNGYSVQRTTIWNPDGEPILVATQNVAIFG